MGNHYSSYHWYRCECGNEKLIRKSSVDRGSTRSCGCLQRENGRRAMARMPEELKGKGAGRKPGFTQPNVNKGKIRIMVDGRRRNIHCSAVLKPEIQHSKSAIQPTLSKAFHQG